MEAWYPYAKVYDPLKAGSIDGTDKEPHDRAIVRAMNAKYKPNGKVKGDPLATVFVGRLNPITTEDTLWTVFEKFGKVKSLRLVRDIVTGYSKAYAFVEYEKVESAQDCVYGGKRIEVDDYQLLVEFECERTMPGWVPRRLGGGFSGKKESGQLRFGGRDKPWKKPIVLQDQGASDGFPGRGRRRNFDEERGDRRDYAGQRSRYSEQSMHRDDRRGYRDRASARYDDRGREDRVRDDRRDYDRRSRSRDERDRSDAGQADYGKHRRDTVDRDRTSRDEMDHRDRTRDRSRHTDMRDRKHKSDYRENYQRSSRRESPKHEKRRSKSRS